MNSLLPDLSVVQPLVTVITITYNSSQYVRDAIESVLRQPYTNFEYIIVDDCSIDNTWDIINEYKDSRIRKYRNEKNLREYPNRNKAVSMANGEYLIFVDGDDLLLYHGIENAVKDMVRFPECSFGVVRPENPKYIGPIKVSGSDALNLEHFGPGVLNASFCNNVFKTSFLKERPFFDNYRNSDTYSRIFFSFFSPVLILMDPIAIWRQSPEQASKKIDVLMALEERLHFYHHHLMPLNKQVKILDEYELGILYNKWLLRCFLKRIGKFRNVVDLKGFMIDGFLQTIKSARTKNKIGFWSKYDYNNVNIGFRQ